MKTIFTATLILVCLAGFAQYDETEIAWTDTIISICKKNATRISLCDTTRTEGADHIGNYKINGINCREFIMNQVNIEYVNPDTTKQYTGTIKITVNCKGEIGNLEVIMPPILGDQAQIRLTNELIKIFNSVKTSQPGKGLNGEPVDITKRITFSIRNGVFFVSKG